MNQVELCEFQTKFNANHLNGSFLNQSGSLVESHIFSYAIALMSLLINYWCLSSIVRNRLINKWQTWKMAVSSVSLPPPPPHDALFFSISEKTAQFHCTKRKLLMIFAWAHFVGTHFYSSIPNHMNYEQFASMLMLCLANWFCHTVLEQSCNHGAFPRSFRLQISHSWHWNPIRFSR